MEKPPEENVERTDFIREIVREHIRTDKYAGRVQTRFPPEPNGYLHIGHAKSIHLNFGIAREFGGKTNLRFDDTNPTKEEVEYVESIKYDVRWLGFDWEEREFYASDYFQTLYEYAVKLIKKGKAYVDDLSADQIREYRGTLSPARRARTGSGRWRRTWTSSSACTKGSSRKARACCGRRSTWPPAT
jgi:glutaminyl-tRNA synthetase